MLSDLGALGYLEYRQFINRARATLHSPGRAALYVFAIGYVVLITAVRSHGRRAIPMTSVPEPYASVVMFVYIAVLGIMAYGAASGILGAFSSTSDARFLTGSLISERIVVVWLQLRRCAASLARMLFTIVLYSLIFSSSGTTYGISLATLGATVVASALAVPVLRFRLSAGVSTAQTCAALLATAGIVPMLILLSSVLQPSRLSAAIERSGAGVAFNALFNGSAQALGALYLFGVLLILLAYACGADLYPDLYAASIRALEFRSRQGRGPGAALTPDYVYTKLAISAPFSRMLDGMRGPWAVTWKELLGFYRSPGMRRTFWFGMAASLGCGALFGAVASRSNNPLADSLTLASVATNMIMIFVAMGSAIGLAVDLRKPLWWIGPDPLWTRLVAWIAGTSWRMAVCICAGVMGWGIAMRTPVVFLAGVPLAIVAVLHLRAVGLVLYSLFPSTIDQRGPLSMVRVLLTYALAAPPAVAGIVLGVVFNSLPLGIAAGLAVSLLQILGLIAFGSKRIERQGVAMAQAEAA
ncbi:MAG TPA: putative ABC exporter domain-containing protein [Candidatus Baltobacteraceae bacterium]|nr:putative ABC exporter domain-containing protein [Candidatus Baltobacteraceae bacterium]